jgi:hypothetical protein
MFEKIIPLIIAIGGVVKNQDKIAQLLKFTTVASAQVEMANITKVIQLDSIDGSIPPTDPAQFADYLRRSIQGQTKEIKRDFSLDMWGIPYRLELKNRVATVLSAGPDKTFTTGDDIRCSVDLY